MQSFEEYRQEVHRRNKPRTFKVRNSFGSYDIYKLIRKNHWFNIGQPVSEKDYYAIIRGVNKLLAENLSNGITVELPEGMGNLELRKYERGVSIVDGKLKNTYPINWEDTVRLWFEDKEAEKNKTLVRREEKQVYRVVYDKRPADYINQYFYAFTLNRLIKRALKDNIHDKKIDTLW